MKEQNQHYIKPNTRGEPRGKPLVFRPTKSLEQRILAARKMTGYTQTGLMERCCAKSLKNVIDEILAERAQANDDYKRLFTGNLA